MDPLTHCLVGGMVAKTTGTSNRRFWIMMFLGAAPDLDVIFNFFGSWAFWLQHRGISHSLLGMVLQPLFFAWALQRWDKGPFRQRALHYSLPLGLHVVCDYLTHYGVPLLSPFTFRDYSADLMVGLAILPILFMTVGLAWMYVKGTSGWSATRPMWAGWMLYFMMAVSGKAYASKLVEFQEADITTFPSIANPFEWSAIYPDEDQRTYQRVRIDLFQGKTKSTQIFSMPEADFPVQASLESNEVEEFLKKNRWPVARVSKLGDGWKVEWGHLLFSTRGTVRGKIAVTLDSEGTVLSEKKIFNFWTPASS